MENNILRAVQQQDIHVDKHELLRALQYDRSQYEKGYEDAMTSIVRCKDCKKYNADSEFCNFWHGVRHPEHYCGEGERSDGDEETCP